MKFSRLRAHCVVLGVVVQSVTSFIASGNFRLMTSTCSAIGGVRYGKGAAVNVSFTSQRRGCSSLRMGAAGKKKKKLEKEALKSVGAFSKTVSRELKKEADILANGLLKKCGEAKRDISGITTVISDLRSKTAALKPAQSVDLMKDWRLVFVTDDDTLSTVGTGLHKLPLTRMQDFFMTLSGGSTSNRRIESIEVLRVLGPFPNIRNTLSGDCRSTGPVSLKIRYTSMIDGTGKETGSSATGEQDRLVDVEVAFAGQGALVLETKTGSSSKIGYLVFAAEPDMYGELAKLRVEGDAKPS